jgi:heme exporter protein CcmB
MLGLSSDLICHYHLSIIWVCFVLSLIPERFFHQDFEDGSLELFYLSRWDCGPLFMTHLISFWHLKILGILMSLPLLSCVYQFEQSLHIYITMILGSLALILLLAFYSSLTLQVESTSWTSLHYFTVFPILLPLILVCVAVEAGLFQFGILLGFVLFLFWMTWFFLSLTVRTVLSN